MIVTIIILSILLIISLFVIFNLLRKVERIDDELIDISFNMEEFIVSIKSVYKTLKEVDNKGAFQSDDEVGSIFKDIKELIVNINTKYDIEENIDEE